MQDPLVAPGPKSPVGSDLGAASGAGQDDLVALVSELPAR